MELVQKTWKNQIARGISNFGNPFTLLFILSTWASFHFLIHAQAMKIVLIFLLFAFLPTGVFIAFNVRRGKYSNYDVSTKSQRPSLYLFSIILVSCLTTTLYFLREPLFIVKGCLSALVLLVICYLINIRTKCSLHTAFAVFTAIGFFHLSIFAGVAFMIFALFMGWSRLVLDRHTPNEVFWGGFTGLLIGVLFYFWA